MANLLVPLSSSHNFICSRALESLWSMTFSPIHSFTQCLFSFGYLFILYCEKWIYVSIYVYTCNLYHLKSSPYKELDLVRLKDTYRKTSKIREIVVSGIDWLEHRIHINHLHESEYVIPSLIPVLGTILVSIKKSVLTLSGNLEAT